MNSQELARLCLRADRTLRDVMVCLNDSAKGIVLVVDDEQRLLCTMTDGDLRRAILHGLDQEMTIAGWMAQRCSPPKPRTAFVGADRAELLTLMEEGYRHIPLLDDTGRVADVAMLNDLVARSEPALHAVVMAGGLGTRLRPLTTELPKPMLQIGDKPLMEHIVMRLRAAGIEQVRITTHYKADVITNHFGNGQRFGVKIDYLNEDDPLGTAGALGLMSEWVSTLLVVNGDILTTLNYQTMLEFHRENGAVMTVGVRQYEVEVPYGVVQTEGVQITKLSEKPTMRFFVNAGVYLLEPKVSRHMPARQRCDMTDLIAKLLADDERVVSFPINEYWLDIGHRDNYELARAAFAREEFH